MSHPREDNCFKMGNTSLHIATLCNQYIIHGARKISVFLANARNIFSHPLRFRFFTRTVVLLRNRSDYRGIRFFLYYEKWDPYPIILVFFIPCCAYVRVRLHVSGQYESSLSIGRLFQTNITQTCHWYILYIQGPFTWVRLVTEKIW